VVGLFGSLFLDAESEYLRYGANVQCSPAQGGMEDEDRDYRGPADIS
jgi:hypothetical protein